MAKRRCDTCGCELSPGEIRAGTTCDVCARPEMEEADPLFSGIGLDIQRMDESDF